MIVRAALWLAFVAMLVMSPVWSDDADALSPVTTAEIEYLLDHVSRSPNTFVRNGDDHTGPEAAKHMRRKYEHFLKKGKIKDTGDFIDLAGTKSLMSGKPYVVLQTDGAEVMTADWLRSELEAYRTNRGAALQ